jgi:hypothetical protein
MGPLAALFAGKKLMGIKVSQHKSEFAFVAPSAAIAGRFCDAKQSGR